MVVRAVCGIVVVLALLFMADQEFADGHYTRIAQKALTRIRAAIGT